MYFRYLGFCLLLTVFVSLSNCVSPSAEHDSQRVNIQRQYPPIDINAMIKKHVANGKHKNYAIELVHHEIFALNMMRDYARSDLETVDDMYDYVADLAQRGSKDGKYSNIEVLQSLETFNIAMKNAPIDRDNDGVLDRHDNCPLHNPGQFDCNDNGVGDVCDLDEGTSIDCNRNNIPDECDIYDGTSKDSNSNHIPDECE